MKVSIFAICIFSLAYSSTFGNAVDIQETVQNFFKTSSLSASTSGHTSNWAVIVSTTTQSSSSGNFNFRHIANALSIYRTVKRLGIPDSRIVLMLADDVACNPRNKFPATVFNNVDRKIDLYGGSIGQDGHDGDVEVDYRGNEVTVENIIRVLTGRHFPETPKSKRLTTDDKSNILVYMTGHGGEEFLKFQDVEEISSHDLADAFEQMNEKKRYNEILYIVDTCQANTMYTHFYSPNVIASGSSKKGESSYSHHHSSEIGVAVIDRYTYYLLDFMERNVLSMQSNQTLLHLFDSLNYFRLHSEHGVRIDLFQRNYESTQITDFFGNVPILYVTEEPYSFDGNAELRNIHKCSHFKLDTGSVILPLITNSESIDSLEMLYNDLMNIGMRIYTFVTEYLNEFKKMKLKQTGKPFALKKFNFEQFDANPMEARLLICGGFIIGIIVILLAVIIF